MRKQPLLTQSNLNPWRHPHLDCLSMKNVNRKNIRWRKAHLLHMNRKKNNSFWLSKSSRFHGKRFGVKLMVSSHACPMTQLFTPKTLEKMALLFLLPTILPTIDASTLFLLVIFDIICPLFLMTLREIATDRTEHRT